jgi:hypothetical protein
MSLAKPGKTSRLMGTGMGLARQEAPGRVFGLVWNRTEPFFRSKSRPLAGYPDPLLTLLNPLQYKHLPSANLFARSSAEILL